MKWIYNGHLAKNIRSGLSAANGLQDSMLPRTLMSRETQHYATTQSSSSLIVRPPPSVSHHDYADAGSLPRFITGLQDFKWILGRAVYIASRLFQNNSALVSLSSRWGRFLDKIVALKLAALW